MTVGPDVGFFVWEDEHQDPRHLFTIMQASVVPQVGDTVVGEHGERYDVIRRVLTVNCVKGWLADNLSVTIELKERGQDVVKAET